MFKKIILPAIATTLLFATPAMAQSRGSQANHVTHYSVASGPLHVDAPRGVQVHQNVQARQRLNRTSQELRSVRSELRVSTNLDVQRHLNLAGQRLSSAERALNNSRGANLATFRDHMNRADRQLANARSAAAAYERSTRASLRNARARANALRTMPASNLRPAARADLHSAQAQLNHAQALINGGQLNSANNALSRASQHLSAAESSVQLNRARGHQHVASVSYEARGRQNARAARGTNVRTRR